MYHCLPTNVKCEWAILRNFVTQFNTEFHTQYTRTKCLDLDGAQGPQPEMLLDSPGQKSLVIERKSLVYPKDYIKYHQTDHYFGNIFFEKLGNTFNDDAYQLEINPEDLRGNKKRIHDMATQVADTILSHQGNIKGTGYISSFIPIKWTFKRLEEIEKDEDTPERGIAILFDKYPDFFSTKSFNEFYANPYEWLTTQGLEQEKKESKARKEIATIAQGLLLDTAAKFTKYSDCLRVLLFEVYIQEMEYFIIQETIKSVDIPDNIDHIWLSNYYSDGHNYERIYTRSDCSS